MSKFKKDIINSILNDTSKKLNKNYISKTILYNYILDFRKKFNFENYKFTEVFYHYINDKLPTKCLNENCNNKPKYLSIKRGYRKYCSFKCRSNCNVWKNKVKQTNLKKLNVENPFQSEKIKKCIKNTNLKNIGWDNPSKSLSFKNKIKEYHLENFYEKYKNYNIQYIDNDIICCLCDNCKEKYKIYKKTFFSRMHYNYTICTKCNPIKSKNSSKEKNIVNFIKNYYKGEIIINNRSILNGKELDIYLPDKKIAIEFNGNYWHSSFKVDSKYHIWKTEECEKKGIKLLHIFEYMWDSNKDFIKSLILNNIQEKKKIKKNYLIKEIKNIDEFLNKNHYKNIKCSIKLGLYYNGELISIMGFRKNGNNYNIIFCNKNFFSVSNSFDLLISYFKKKYNYENLIFKINRDFYNLDDFHNYLNYDKLKPEKIDYFDYKIYNSGFFNLVFN